MFVPSTMRPARPRAADGSLAQDETDGALLRRCWKKVSGRPDYFESSKVGTDGYGTPPHPTG